MLPSISIIIPTYNEESRLPFCLGSIRAQNYPQENLEIIVVDDNSTDATIDIARQYNCKLQLNGFRNIERGKSIGFQSASCEYILLIDADNILPDVDWLNTCVTAYLENPEIFGVEAIWFEHKNFHSLADRYCELFGINDPFVYYLKNQDKMGWFNNEWNLKGSVLKNTENYYIVEFNKTNCPTVGSQGFLTKKILFEKISTWPYLFHMDSQLELIEQNGNVGRYAFIKKGIIHLHSKSTLQLIKKLHRNITLFYKQKDIRKYKYNINMPKLFFTTILMITIIRPLYDAIKGCVKKPDVAWFLHPLLCVLVPFMYSFITIKCWLRNLKDCLKSLYLC